MSTLKEVAAQETELKNKLEQTKQIDERRKIRAELRALRAKKEKLTNENGFEKPQSTVSSSPVVITMNRRSDRFEEKSKNNAEPVKVSLKNEGNEVKVARSTYKFEMNSSKVDTETRRYQINQNNGSAIEEKRPRKDQDYNNNNNNQENMDRGSVAVAPQRMSRRKSLVELFKIDEGAKGGRKARMAQPDIPESARLPVSGPPSSRRDVIKQDDQTKKDLIQNLGRLRSRRRSVREIQNRDELEGLMYVKQGDSVKLVSTSEGDEEVKEQRRMRRTSRKEMQDKFRIDGNTVSYQDKKEEVLSPLKEESPSPASANQQFRYGTNSVNKPDRTNSFGRNEPPRPASQPGRIGGRPGPTGPKSFLPGKEEAQAPAKLSGSVADRMKYFREQAELEKKKVTKQMPVKKVPPPSPTPVSNTPATPVTRPATNENKERVSLKKAPDPNKAPRDLKKKPPLKRQMSVSSLILTWCKDVTAGYPGVNITNFSGSFANGLAFCALIHKFNPDKFDFNSLNAEDRWNNFQLAFDTASSVGIPALLDVEDMFRMKKPEPRSVQCYVQMIFSKYRPKDLDMSNLRIA